MTTDTEALVEELAQAMFTCDGVCSGHDWANANEIARVHFRNITRAILPIIEADRTRYGIEQRNAGIEAAAKVTDSVRERQCSRSIRNLKEQSE